MGGAGDRGVDADVLHSAAAGEDWALTVLYRRHQPALLRFLTGLAGSEAEDLAADTWIDTARALRGLHGDEDDVRRLLFTIARRRAIDHRRKTRRRRTDPTDPHQLHPRTTRRDVGEEVADAVSSEAAVRRIGALLPAAQAEVVLLRVVAGLSVAEVAAIVRRRPAAVSVLQSRGLRRLAQVLGGASEQTTATGTATGREDLASAQVRRESNLVHRQFREEPRFLQDPHPLERWDG